MIYTRNSEQKAGVVYPKNFEQKTGFTEIRELLRKECLSKLGESLVDEMAFSVDAGQVNTWMEQLREMRRIGEEGEEFPLADFTDVRQSVKRARLEGTWMEEQELFDLRRTLRTVGRLVKFLRPENGTGANADDAALSSAGAEDHIPTDDEKAYPALYDLADGIATFPVLVQQIDQILDKEGRIRDNATPELADIRRQLARTEGSISRILNGILHAAQADGVVEKDVAPTMRDGRLVIPVAPGLKRRINGIVHDESASGKTVFIEPTEVVEANNKVRELEQDERKEVIRILTTMTARIRPHVREILDSVHFLAQLDFINAKTRLARQMQAFEPKVQDSPYVDWIRARHPLLERRLKTLPQPSPRGEGAQLPESDSMDNLTETASPSPLGESRGGVPGRNGSLVPLDIMLTPEKHILIISGPNAGGKSVCLKTVGLLQYMLQTGLAIPVDPRSRCGLFHDIMIDIGDEQSLENDLSTYSSHLLNMKNMMRQASPRTLILIDEFGTGTEPQIGGAIAQSVLEQFCKKGAWAVITTHYQNLKHFADTHDGVVNGAMLYDRHEMRPLFQLAIGRPGSSFAIDIARKIGLPEEVIKEASDIVGSDYIQSDKYLQDIVRDKRYWEQKRQTIHQQEKRLQEQIDRYEHDITSVDRERKEILTKARQEAEEMLHEGNRRIENAIREIREQQAEKESTRRIRQELDSYRQEVEDADTKADDDDKIARKIEQIKARKARHEERQKNKRADQQKAAEALRAASQRAQKVKEGRIEVGDSVRMRGTHSTGRVESIDGKMATVIFGEMRTKLPLGRLTLAEVTADETPAAAQPSKMDTLREGLQAVNVSHMTQDTIDAHRKNFRQDLDVRGMRGDEALQAVQSFVDDAILVGMSRVRILHGKGNGILRQLIRQYLSSEPNVTDYHDEDVRFGGAGITVVDLG